MKYCNDCHSQFETPKPASVIHFEVNERDRECFSVCPKCDSSDFEEMHQCLTSYDWIKSSKDYCGDCLNEGYLAISKLAIKLDIGINEAKDLLTACMEVD